MQQTKRQQQKEQTRQKIIETAFYLYADKGFSTPTNVIAQEAGLSHGTIFVHFPNTDTLQLTVLEHFAEEVGNRLHTLSAKGGSIPELLNAHIDILIEYELFYTKLISEISSLPNETRLLLISLQSAMSIHFSAAIEQAQLSGLIKALPLHMLFNTWIALLHYYIQNGDLFAPGESVLASRRNELVSSYMALISK